MNSADRAKIGRIDYANVWPIFHTFDPRLLQPEAEVRYAVPSRLNRLLLAGDIDMAAISSFAYAMHADDYFLLPDLSVSAQGRVRSILLFLKRPLEEALRGTIALTSTSATSVNLLKIIAQLRYGAQPAYAVMEPELETMLEQADAALLIGDSAIRASWRDTGYEVVDLGELWREWTGHGMTFALLALRRDAAARLGHARIAAMHEALLASKQRSLSDPEPLISKACATLGGEPDYWRRYFAGLTYDFGASQRSGLELYCRYAVELGLLERVPDMQEWS
ncbi:menaquinone biosynthesis protein [Paenibacillus sp. IB182496]|uniref:Chorismate dehydratase n=1 Tax=Paenibacillus sabuli TaxID=2772509 RepID=A0A927BSW4_9BACL|nr:menaquinone biosynthesis protein [Paenibacillus sabuli]MBD2845165.1 menaquinone biosynthesis protein [Paenibacillus sabuli]